MTILLRSTRTNTHNPGRADLQVYSSADGMNEALTDHVHSRVGIWPAIQDQPTKEPRTCPGANNGPECHPYVLLFELYEPGQRKQMGPLPWKMDRSHVRQKATSRRIQYERGERSPLYMESKWYDSCALVATVYIH